MSSSTFISHVATIEIPVINLEQSVNFYMDVLGVELEFKGEKNAMLTFKKEGVPTFFLVETETTQGTSFKNTNTGVVHSVIDFYTPRLQDFYQWLKEKNIEVGPLNIHPKNGYGGFGFKDPNGNLLSATNVLHEGQ
ncbi:VOC family protein [Mesobacillus maritimus]|uniref:VOC family protein n=1 Tax=Mesobacillus maritimus TaxID=1643336 RepID=UPI00203AA48F|nr:VOC family protein [Mesobacillus maritimus]MCM3586719.1 VOC family protein [Mesobacillus maritimus]MCM3668528.1 VOC family protein [Mesobacillus maritimus]